MQVKKLIRLLSSLSIVLFIQVQVSSAQQSGSYDDNEYDGEYEYSEQDKYNPQNDFYNRSERTLKRSYEEDELYNGGYRRKPGSSESGSIGAGGSINLGGLSRKRTSGAANDDAPVNNHRFNRYDGIENGVGTNPSRYNNSDAHPFEEVKEQEQSGKGQENPDSSDPKTPPPPPDEPDVPVDSAIPLLIVVGIGLAGYRFSGFKFA